MHTKRLGKSILIKIGLYKHLQHPDVGLGDIYRIFKYINA